MKLISVKDLSRDEWLMLRKQGIGGSDAGAVCGVNPYKSAFNVYTDKTSPDVHEEDNERMRQGRDLEDYCAKRFSEATGVKVRRTGYMFRHDDYPFMIADLDRIIAHENAGLECKTASAYSADKWKSADTVPEQYIIQCQHYMAVTGFKYMYLACVVLGSDFVFYRIDRDEEMIANIIKIEKEFWENNVLARCIPDPDGSEAYDNALNGYFTAKKESAIPLIGLDGILDRRREISGLMTRLETEKKTIDQKLKLYLNENEVAENEKYRVSWKACGNGSRRLSVRIA